MAYDTARRCQLFSMRQGVDPSLTLRDGGIPPSGGYWLAFLGIDYMASGSAATFARIVNHPASEWDANAVSTSS